MQMAIAILHTRDEQLLTIRRRALELVGKIMSHCGFDATAPFIDQVINQLTVVGGVMSTCGE